MPSLLELQLQALNKPHAEPSLQTVYRPRELRHSGAVRHIPKPVSIGARNAELCARVISRCMGSLAKVERQGSSLCSAYAVGRRVARIQKVVFVR